MKFKIKASGTFIVNISLITLAFGMAAFCFFMKNEIWRYAYILWLFIAILRFSVYKKYLRIVFNNSSVLEANETYIYDIANDIKYDWIDIDEIYEENAYLRLKLYNPNKYLEKINNPLKRFIVGVSGSPFKINIDMIDVNPSVLLEILNNYSIQAASMNKID